ncbi:hypothetical protein EHH54_34710 [Rhizobium leguminosarum]|uniref:hypothetical protein n=1 Tax=Rhizobium leguminosarum TaxID=384 RepID=UPI000FEC23F9|nr:hypothetical protein [Rhizobium leguminosarum]RWX26619.1 hypothetical protein EHH54_34710 [Rhizobium leguminosarum]
MYRPSPEDFDDVNVPVTACAASSAEPFARADHKSKKHPKPRRQEKIGGGHFVFRRGADGRIGRGGWPFEHPNEEAAQVEATRLQTKHGGTFEVFSRSSIVDGSEAGEDWDAVPVNKTGGAA